MTSDSKEEIKMLLIAAIFMTVLGFHMLIFADVAAKAYCLVCWLIAFFLWMILLRSHNI